jgi:SAM-dependent methyltransferase
VATAPERAVYQPDQYWNERLRKDFSLSGVGHSGVGLAFNRWAYQVRRQVLLRALRQQGIALQGARILELGFGTGFYLDLWQAMGAAQVSGYDIAEIAVEEAGRRFNLPGWSLQRGDIGSELPLGEAAGRCDLATAFDVLFHLVEERAWLNALDNLQRALKPGGHAILFDKFQTRESGVSHVRRRTLAAYREALQARGLQIVEIRPIFFFMNSPTDLTGPRKLLAKTAWSLVKTPYKLGRPLGLGDLVGGWMGALLYGPELLLSRLCRGGPSTKLLLARKSGAAQA